MLVKCRLTSLNYLIQRKTIVVVGRCISLPNHELMVESNFWWYLQLISVTLPAYRSTGTCCAPKTCLSRFLRSLTPPKWMILSPRRALDVLYRGLTAWLNSFSWSLRPLNVMLRHWTFSAVEFCMNVDPPNHCFKSTQ